MKTISLQGISIPYTITRKNNKHTYFYFKRAGYIQVNMSKRQTTQDVLNYITNHADSFVQKYEKHCLLSKENDEYKIWGKTYTVIQSEKDEIELDTDNNVINVGIYTIDHTKVKTIEKQLITQEVLHLFQTYQSHDLVDIDTVKLSIRSMVSRFGSCNKHKRRITINLDLVHFDKRYLTYVFLHEISHLVHDNHSKEYYALLEQLCPNYKTLRRELKDLW